MMLLRCCKPATLRVKFSRLSFGSVCSCVARMAKIHRRQSRSTGRDATDPVVPFGTADGPLLQGRHSAKTPVLLFPFGYFAVFWRVLPCFWCFAATKRDHVLLIFFLDHVKLSEVIIVQR
jgi:hypothetical protein